MDTVVDVLLTLAAIAALVPTTMLLLEVAFSLRQPLLPRRPALSVSVRPVLGSRSSCRRTTKH